MIHDVKFRVGKYRYPATIDTGGDALKIRFNYHPDLVEEVKIMEGARWNPELKTWTVTNSQRNLFAISFLTEKNPYERYDKPLIPFTPRRQGMLREHQITMASHVITRRQCILAAEMRTGKTLALIEAIEFTGYTDCIWVAPKSAKYGVELEFEKWTVCDVCGKLRSDHKDESHPMFTTKCVRPLFMTYEALTRIVEKWPENKEPPHFLVLDESSRCKNPTAQRSQAGLSLANAMRDRWGDECFVVEMSGSPSPGKPTDWWMQCEIARPGFLREGSIQKFNKRLAVIENRENQTTGGVYPHLVCWRDSEKRCEKCGLMDTDVKHDLASGGHTFQPCVNEIAALYKRMNGLVHVKFKKDCWELPPIDYKIIHLQPSPEMLRAASLINAKSSSAIEALTLLRELSDGFQYREEECGRQQCPNCKGTRVRRRLVDAVNPDMALDALSIESGYRVIYDDAGTPTRTDEKLDLREQEVACDACDGTGEVVRLARTTTEVKSPKEDMLQELIDLHEEAGRIVVYGGFTGTIDKIVSVFKRMKWDYIRVDGRGWETSLRIKDPVRMLAAFQSDKTIERLGFIGQPSSAGMGIDLAASPGAVYYSNDFNAESRIQSAARIHGPAMNLNRGATIWDLILLPSDLLVLNNLDRKKRLQDISLGEMRDEIAKIKFSDIRTM